MNYWTRRRPDGKWEVKTEGVPGVSSIADTRQEAWNQCQELACKSGGEAFLCNRDPSMQTALDHGQGVYSLFFHLDSIDVKTGTYVEKGSKVAEIGATGITVGSHLHWSIYVNGVWVNPMDWLEIKF